MTVSSAPSGVVPAVRAQQLAKSYGSGETLVHALRGVDVSIARGEFVAIMGPSGSGKSTLMHCLAGLDTVTSGRAFVGDAELTGLGDRELTRLRSERIGFVFQAFNLVPTLTAKQNILLPSELSGSKHDDALLESLARTLDITERLGHRPHELSGGQQQRVAIARALLTRPDVIFADEPTGNLDSAVGAEVLSLLQRSAKDLGQTIVMVTHDPVAAAAADRVLLLADGRIAGELRDHTAESVLSALGSLAASRRSAAEQNGETR